MEHPSGPGGPSQSVWFAVSQQGAREWATGDASPWGSTQAHSAGHKHNPSTKLAHHSVTGLLKTRSLQLQPSSASLHTTTTLQHDSPGKYYRGKNLSRRPHCLLHIISIWLLHPTAEQGNKLIQRFCVWELKMVVAFVRHQLQEFMNHHTTTHSILAGTQSLWQALERVLLTGNAARTFFTTFLRHALLLKFSWKTSTVICSHCKLSFLGACIEDKNVAGCMLSEEKQLHL